mmetsp:Transcript_42609/g.104966  ORF Transcript_42609/g.104966 Transcript_42609/m.104966 type:complete len:213 (+) Transcript_42609:881-1519(+)
MLSEHARLEEDQPYLKRLGSGQRDIKGRVEHGVCRADHIHPEHQRALRDRRRLAPQQPTFGGLGGERTPPGREPAVLDIDLGVADLLVEPRRRESFYHTQSHAPVAGQLRLKLEELMVQGLEGAIDRLGARQPGVAPKVRREVGVDAQARQRHESAQPTQRRARCAHGRKRVAGENIYAYEHRLRTVLALLVLHNDDLGAGLYPRRGIQPLG